MLSKNTQVIHKCYQNEPIFNGAYSRNNLPKIKNEAYFINRDGYKLKKLIR